MSSYHYGDNIEQYGDHNIGKISNQVTADTQLIAGDQLAARAAPTAVRTESVASVSPEGKEHWARSRKVWALAIGFTTIVGGVAAVLALFIH